MEGMGKIVDDHAAPNRHLALENYAKEAMIDWNAPKVTHAEPYLRECLDHKFVAQHSKWNFMAENSKFSASGTTSAVIHRKSNENSNFNFM